MLPVIYLLNCMIGKLTLLAGALTSILTLELVELQAFSSMKSTRMTVLVPGKIALF
jgi:hypothetical protein